MDIEQEEASAKRLSGHDVFIRTHLMYRDPLNRDAMAVTLFREAFRAFTDTLLIKRRYETKAENAEASRWLKENTFDRLDSFPRQPYSFEQMEWSLFETLKIAGGFELALKALLIEADYIVHQISPEAEYEVLKKRQKTQPIYKSEILAISGYRYNGEMNYLPGLTVQSLVFSTIMKNSAYREALPLAKDMLDIIEELRLLRNQIHLPGDIIPTPKIAALGVALVDFVINFVNDEIVVRTNNLVTAHNLRKLDRLSPISW